MALHCSLGDKALPHLHFVLIMESRSLDMYSACIKEGYTCSHCQKTLKCPIAVSLVSVTAALLCFTLVVVMNV